MPSTIEMRSIEGASPNGTISTITFLSEKKREEEYDYLKMMGEKVRKYRHAFACFRKTLLEMLDV